MHHQRHRRTGRERQPGRDRDGLPHPPRPLPLRDRHSQPRNLPRQPPGQPPQRDAGAAQQGHRGRQRLRARVRHSPGRRDQGPRNLRDHERRTGGPRGRRAGHGQAQWPRRLPQGPDRPGLPGHSRRQGAVPVRALQGSGRPQGATLRRRPACPGGRPHRRAADLQPGRLPDHLRHEHDPGGLRAPANARRPGGRHRPRGRPGGRRLRRDQQDHGPEPRTGNVPHSGGHARRRRPG